MKILQSFLIFAMGIAVGMLILYLRETDSTKGNVTPKDSKILTGFYIDKKAAPSLRIGWPEAQNMHDDYVRDVNNNFRFTYHDPADTTGATIIYEAVLEGFSFDTADVNYVLSTKPDKLYMMIGEKQRPVNPNGKGPNDKIFSTILVGLRKSASKSLPDGDYTYIQSNVVDYSNPCPPYCPGN